jgi:hypothetical protein
MREETARVDEHERKTLTDVLSCLRELVRQVDAGQITVDAGQRAYLQGALDSAERMAAEHAASNGL